MLSTSKFRNFVNNSAKKINDKLDIIDANKLARLAKKEELAMQKISQQKEKQKKQAAKKTRQQKRAQRFRQRISYIGYSIKDFFENLFSNIKHFLYIVLRSIIANIKKIYVKTDYKASVKAHRKLISHLYSRAGITSLAANHDVDLLSSKSTNTAIRGKEPLDHKYISQHHIEYWAQDGVINEIPFEQTLEIMCDMFASAYNHDTKTIDYMLALALLEEKQEKYTINGVLVSYFVNSITHAQKHMLVAPDYSYCKTQYEDFVLF